MLGKHHVYYTTLCLLTLAFVLCFFENFLRLFSFWRDKEVSRSAAWMKDESFYLKEMIPRRCRLRSNRCLRIEGLVLA